MNRGEDVFVWGIPIISSYSKSLSSLVSKHFYIINDWDMSEHETFYFSSPHLHNICTRHPEIAFYRAKALLRIMNGIQMLTNSPPVVFDSNTIYNFSDYGKRNIVTIKENSQLEYNELQNPFLDEEYLIGDSSNPSFKPNNYGHYEVDLFELSYNEALVKEALILFSLSKIQPLYSLINTSKIIENIKFDLGLIETKHSKEILNRISRVLKIDDPLFLNAYEFLTNTKGNGFQRFINTRDGSGIFSRHGEKRQHFRDKDGNKFPEISFTEIEYNLRILISEWINYKLINLKGYRYPPIKKKPKSRALTDADFLFD